MGESVVKAPDVQNKMGGTVTPHGGLEVSISFGRYENDSLSWEKWSTFSQNKYLEEVEKCSTPGSVAQKKAYFEAHYKKIAAKKAELLEKEKMTRTDSSRSNELNCTDHSTSSSGSDAEQGILDSQRFDKEFEQDTYSLMEVSTSLVTEPAEDCKNVLECENSQVESTAEEINEKLRSELVIHLEKADLMTEVQDTDDQHQKTCSETINVKGPEENSEMSAQNTTTKVSQTKKEQNLARSIKKKPVLPATKSSETSTPKTRKSSKPVLTSTTRVTKPVPPFTVRVTKPVPNHTPRSSKPVPISTPSSSKPVPTSTPRSSKTLPISTPRSSKPGSVVTPTSSKQVSRSCPTLCKSVSKSTAGSLRPASASTSRLSKPISSPIGRPASQSSPRRKNYTMKVIERAVPIHKSLDSFSLTTSRKSLIMEQMGDKDIVKRAFKSFQNNLSQLNPSHGEKLGVPRPISARRSEHSNSITSQKENGSSTSKATEKMNAYRNPVGTKWNPTLSRSTVETRTRRTLKPSLSLGLKSDERAEKRKAFFKDLEEKSNAREVEKNRLLAEN